MQLLFGQVNVKKLKEALENLPKGLNDMYQAIWDRIFLKQDEQRQVIACTALTWITYAKELLEVDQLLHAVAVDLDPDISDIDSDDLIDVDTLLSSCLGLVVVNEKTGTIRLVHETTQTYLESRFNKLDANTSIAKTCLKYLGFPLELLEADLNACIEKYRMAPYAAIYWAEHIHLGNGDGEESITQDVLDIISSQAKRDILGQLLELATPEGLPFFKFTVLHVLSMYGLSRICRTYLTPPEIHDGDKLCPSNTFLMIREPASNSDVDSKDEFGRTPLSWAAEYGHSRVVKLLLDAHAEVDSKDDKYGQTPLSWAVEKGHSGLVKLLLDAHAEVDSKDKYGWTPLNWAAKNGHSEAVKVLLAANAKIQMKNRNGQTPAMLARDSGHWEIEEFLEREAIRRSGVQ